MLTPKYKHHSNFQTPIRHRSGVALAHTRRVIAVLRHPWSGVVGALALIAVATLVSVSAVSFGGGVPFWCLACGDYGFADAIANVALFVPLGWALARTRLSRSAALYVIVATTVFVESLQGLAIAGRVPSMSDVLTNSAGGLLGLRIPLLLARATATSRIALRAAVSYGIAIAGLIAASVVVQAIPAPNFATMTWKQAVPRLPGYTEFKGSLREVHLDPVRVGLVSQTPDAQRSEIISTWRGDGTAWMWIDQQDRDLRTHVASRSDALRLRGHSPVLGDVMPAAAGTPVLLVFEAARYKYQLRVTTPTTDRVRSLAISPAGGWRLLVPFERTRERFAEVLTAAWMAALIAPLGFLAARSSRRVFAGSAFGSAACLLILPGLLGCAAVPGAGWLGAAAGMAMTGWLGSAPWAS